MPFVRGTTSSRGATVRGGRKLARFLRRFGDPDVTGEAMARGLAKVMRRTVLPWLKQYSPRRTGKMRQSLRVVQRGDSVELRVIWYGRFQRVGPNRDQSLAEYAVDLIERNRALIRAQMWIEIRAAVGI